MRQGLISILLGLVGGVGGALALGALGGGGSPPPEGSSAEEARLDPAALLRRIEMLEERLAQADRGARLEGRAPPAAPTAAPRELTEPEIARLEARLLERLEPRLDEVLEEKWDELASEGGEVDLESEGRKRMALADVAREISLTASEEDELRRIYEDSTQRFLEVFAKPDGDVELVRRDFETFQNDESARRGLVAKYLPKLMTGLGDVMTIEADKEKRIREALGPEKAAELSGFEVVEERPFGMQAAIGISTREDR